MQTHSTAFAIGYLSAIQESLRLMKGLDLKPEPEKVQGVVDESFEDLKQKLHAGIAEIVGHVTAALEIADAGTREGLEELLAFLEQHDPEKHALLTEEGGPSKEPERSEYLAGRRQGFEQPLHSWGKLGQMMLGAYDTMRDPKGPLKEHYEKHPGTIDALMDSLQQASNSVIVRAQAVFAALADGMEPEEVIERNNDGRLVPPSRQYYLPPTIVGLRAGEVERRLRSKHADVPSPMRDLQRRHGAAKGPA